MDIQQIPIERIRLDARNPRIAHTLEAMSEAPSQDFIEMSLGLHAPEDEERGASTTYSSLKASIRASQGLILPIIVSPREDGTYLVVEGNTRVAIYRELAGEEAPGDWSSIPAIVQSLDEEGEHAIRLQAHLVGPRPWRPYAKAKYLHDLYVNQKLSITEILDFCGGTARRREIEQYIAAYTDMHDHYMPLVEGSGAQPDYSRFSAFVELQKTPGLKQAIARAGYTLKDFSRWLHDSKIMPLQDVRKLDRILSNPQARKEFEKHNTREAVKILEQPSSNAVISSASLEQLAKALAAKMRSLNWPDVQALMADTQSEASQSLIDCFEELKALVRQLGHTPDE
jgi:hypothetical protein